MADADVRRAAERAALKAYLDKFRLNWFTPIQLDNVLSDHLGWRPDYTELERWLYRHAEMGLIERNTNGREYRAGPLSESLQEFSRRLADREYSVRIGHENAARLRAWLAEPNGSCILGDRLTVEAVEGGGLLVRTKPWRANA